MLKIANRHARISVRPEVMGGKPCIKGTRIPVDLILRYLGDGQSVEDILEAFPGLLRASVGDLEGVAARLAHLVAHAGTGLSGAITVLDDRGVRSRPFI